MRGSAIIVARAKKNELAYLVRATDADPNVLHIGGNLVKLKGTKVFFLSPECMR